MIPLRHSEDLAHALALFDLEETYACADLKLRKWVRDGKTTGRLSNRGHYGGGFVRRVSKRLALRHGYPGWCITIRATDTGQVVRLPLA